ncbi:hypothetical protein RHSIM_Rhsim12G0011300 [Rhododendron simsii]|uniref:Reverse transcriptase zinc-binding domain-containing protein n=1 Tax=Rhododendron simsii TaxID=118357 RepID=A0A834L8W9_RHOSS|nr:hypothetical protein RHSIM_Rhsim12G0011300 [Rhododendron simsii]
MVAWSKLTQDKGCGGLGIKNERKMNEALLMKWRWRWRWPKETTSDSGKIYGLETQGNGQDRLIWQGCSSGKFTVKSIYEMANRSNADKDPIFELIWRDVAPPRVQCFGLLTYLGRVKTSEYLLRIGVITDAKQAICKFCSYDFESLDHMFIHYMHA